MKVTRTYNTLGRRILAILAEGGPRKHGVLRAVAGGEERFQPVIQRLLAAGSVVAKRRQGGVHYALKQRRA